ncbi:hypothetical protein HOP50_03g20860 [Chloropicon primus]|nr:hypothetical protein HOP50_03g20860 [Chloropicon primus]
MAERVGRGRWRGRGRVGVVVRGATVVGSPRALYAEGGRTTTLVRWRGTRREERFGRTGECVSTTSGRTTARREERRTWVAVAAEGANGPGEEVQGKTPPERRVEEEESFFLKFVQEVKPRIMDQFTEQASPQVVDAMKQTISNMLGNLPAKYFDVTIKTVGENLAQLMLSVMMTGYMFRNAQYRMDVTHTLALPSPSSEEEEEATATEYAAGSQQIKVSGEVLRWHNEKGAEAVDAMEYIKQLEKELSLLREQVSMHEEANLDRNYLLEFLQKLEPSNIKEMTSGAGEEVLEAMNAFIKRLVGTDYDSDELKGIESKSTSVEMARLLYWLLIVGYSLRTIEVKKELEKAADEEEEDEEEEEGEGEGLQPPIDVETSLEGQGDVVFGDVLGDERDFMDRSYDEDWGDNADFLGEDGQEELGT